MSIQFPTAFVQQYKANVQHLTQQKGSKLRSCVRVETMVGESAYFDQVGATEMVEKNSRHMDTPLINVPHARRQVTATPHVWSELVDSDDKARALIDPTSPYAEAAAMAAGRTIDKKIIGAIDAVARTGKDGSTSTAYNSAMTVGVQVRAAGVTGGNYGLNVSKILEAGERLGSNDVDEDDEKCLIVNARQVKSLLNDNRISSKDYNLIAPLYEGKVAYFGGFKIVMCNRIVEDANSYDKVPYWAKGGMLLGINGDIKTKIAEDPGKNFSTRVFCSIDIGATRMEEVRVGYIECHKTNGPSG